jgi:hypothetical protein
MNPTLEDMARYLGADLHELDSRCGRPWQLWVLDNAEDGWPAAIRRALAAEEKVRRLRLAVEYALDHLEDQRAGWDLLLKETA